VQQNFFYFESQLIAGWGRIYSIHLRRVAFVLQGLVSGKTPLRCGNKWGTNWKLLFFLIPIIFYDIFLVHRNLTILKSDTSTQLCECTSYLNALINISCQRTF